MNNSEYSNVSVNSVQNLTVDNTDDQVCCINCEFNNNNNMNTKVKFCCGNFLWKLPPLIKNLK